MQHMKRKQIQHQYERGSDRISEREKTYDQRVDPRADPRVDPRVDPRADPRFDVRADVMGELRVDARANLDSRADLKVESRTDLRIDHRADHRVDYSMEPREKFADHQPSPSHSVHLQGLSGRNMMPPQSHHSVSPRELIQESVGDPASGIYQKGYPCQPARSPHSGHVFSPYQHPFPTRSAQSAVKADSRLPTSNSVNFGDTPLDLTKPNKSGSQPLDLSVPKSSTTSAEVLPHRRLRASVYPATHVNHPQHADGPSDHTPVIGTRPQISMTVAEHHNRHQDQPLHVYTRDETGIHDVYKGHSEERSIEHQRTGPRQQSEHYQHQRYAPAKHAGSITTGRPLGSISRDPSYPNHHHEISVSPHVISSHTASIPMSYGSSQNSQHEPYMSPITDVAYSQRRTADQQVPHSIAQPYITSREHSQTPQHKVPFAYHPMRPNHPPPSKPPLVGRAEPYVISGKVAPQRSVPPEQKPVPQHGSELHSQKQHPQLMVNQQTSISQPNSLKTGPGRTSTTAMLLGNHPVDDILYLKCNVCSLTYGSLPSIRKHFYKAHGFQPRPENLTIRSIKGHKESSIAAAALSSSHNNIFPTTSLCSTSSSTTPKTSSLVDVSSALSSVAATVVKQECMSSRTILLDVDKQKTTSQSTGALHSNNPHTNVPQQQNNIQEETTTIKEEKPDVQKIVKSEPDELLNGELNFKSDSKVMKCPDCGEEFSTRDWGVFKRHMRAHDQQHTRCQICRQTFSDPVELEEHNISYHSGARSSPMSVTGGTNGSNICTICDIGFAQAGALTKHVKDAHHGMFITDKVLLCAHCNQEFTEHRDLMLHVMTHESSNKSMTPNSEKCNADQSKPANNFIDSNYIDDSSQSRVDGGHISCTDSAASSNTTESLVQKEDISMSDHRTDACAVPDDMSQALVFRENSSSSGSTPSR